MGRHDDNPWQYATRIRLPDELLGLGQQPGFSDVDRPYEAPPEARGPSALSPLMPPLNPAAAPAGASAGLMERLVYVSRAARGLDAGQIYAIIRQSHAGNGPAGVTGALVFLDGWFVQALEGPARTLDAWIGRIRNDPRHAGLQVRSRERAHARLFADQPMALRTRACIDARLLEAFDYRPGFPVGAFPADVLVEFLVQACRRRRIPGRQSENRPDSRPDSRE